MRRRVRHISAAAKLVEVDLVGNVYIPSWESQLD